MPLPFTFRLRRFVFWERLSLGLLLVGALLVAGGCGPKPEQSLPVFGSPDSPRLQQVVAGLKTGLAPRTLEVVCVPEFGPAGDKALSRLRAQHPPLLLVLGSPALIRVAPVEKVTPVVFAMVANPYVTGAADTPSRPDVHQKNITGIATPPPVRPALEHGAHLLGTGAWGMLYDPSEGQAVEVAKLFTGLAPQFGLTPLTETSTQAATDLPALKKLLSRGVRVLYIPPTASAARYAPIILSWGRERQVRVVSSQAEVSHKGAILWVALDYRNLGEEAGRLAKRVLAGENPERIPITEKMPLQVEADESLIHHWSGYPGVSRIPGVTPIK
jgi:putative tryptophan/tyrosine transport system substrate-binding protein